MLCNLIYITHFSFIISQIQLNSAHSSKPILTSLSHLLVFFHRWTHVVISPVNFLSLSVIQFHHMFCEQYHYLWVVKATQPVQRYKIRIDGSIDCAWNSIYYICCRNTSTKNRMVLNVINSRIQNYTQFHYKSYNKLFLLIHIYIYPITWYPLIATWLYACMSFFIAGH
jgi:hypothetical protein